MKKMIIRLFVFVVTLTFCFAGSGLYPSDLRCEFLKNPLGIDEKTPYLSWVLVSGASDQFNKKQRAYQVIVATSLTKLHPGKADLWDSGKVLSEQSVGIQYNGKELRSHMQCYWKVRVWDENDTPSGWSSPAFWTMGLLEKSDWLANWIGLDELVIESVITNTFWIWYPEVDPTTKSAPVGTRYFRRVFEIPELDQVRRAVLWITADNAATIFVNGRRVGSASNFHAMSEFDITQSLVTGKNLLAVSVANVGAESNPAGLVANLRLEFTNGSFTEIITDQKWKSYDRDLPDWTEIGFDDSNWKGSQVLGLVGIPPWGQVSPPENRRLAVRWLRKEINISKKPIRATVYMSGLGLSELYINGKRVSDHVLSPALSEYDKRVFYVTHDVTKFIRKDKNAIGVVIGNGRFFAPRLRSPTETRSFGFPKLIFQMRVEYADGTFDDFFSDQSWKLTTRGPIIANNEYDGEEYDARLEMPGWAEVGFNDSSWQPAQLVSPPAGQLSAQMINPIRITQVIKPIKILTPRPGVYIFDMGQNMVGWCRLKVSGPAGRVVRLRHAETLNADGSLYLDNIRDAKVTDVYILKGAGVEVFEPRFTYHGFRYVELTGFPGTPDFSTIQGCVVHDDVEPVGSFECSNRLLNQIYKNITWGVRGNYRSIPTDCPQRDERQGWLGDRSEESLGEMFMFDVAALYRKWLQDMADAQKNNGSVPDVCPSYWPIYSDNVTWPSSTVIIPDHLFTQYADLKIIKKHYPVAKKWIEYMTGFLKDGLISRDSYGDWCVPPEDPKLIHSNDPNRRTDKTLLASAYFYHDLLLMAKYARILGLESDYERFLKLAENIKTAFNAKFYNKEKGYYDNGTQTSCVLPLAFGLVPEEEKQHVIQHLVRKITTETRGHIGTGLIGGQFLTRVLSDSRRPDLVYTIATQQDYPSWGYMIKKGATTIWELWNGDTADPAMNSGNHVMLVGDLVVWFYEYLAGIRSDPSDPGFKKIIMKPTVVGDLNYVSASYKSIHGKISSTWSIKNNIFSWDIIIPPNTEAILYVPSRSIENIKINGKKALKNKVIDYLHQEMGCQIFRVGSGHYRVTSLLPSN